LSQIRRAVRLLRLVSKRIDVRRRTVTKQDFVDAVADRAGLSKRDAATAVDAVLDTITAALKSRDSVTFTGFGKFSTSDRAARQGVNPRTGERVQIAATTVPKFSAGSALKSAVKGG
jgi:DNA-binding protein HU-beta